MAHPNGRNHPADAFRAPHGLVLGNYGWQAVVRVGVAVRHGGGGFSSPGWIERRGAGERGGNCAHLRPCIAHDDGSGRGSGSSDWTAAADAARFEHSSAGETARGDLSTDGGVVWSSGEVRTGTARSHTAMAAGPNARVGECSWRVCGGT